MPPPPEPLIAGLVLAAGASRRLGRPKQLLPYGRAVFPDLAGLHGDKGVWRLLEQRAGDVTEAAIPGPVPLDVNTEADYDRVLAALRSAS